MHPESSGTGSLQNLSLRLASSKAYDWRISWNSFFALYCCPWQYNQEQYSSDYDNFISLWFFTDSNRLKNDWTAISYNPKASPQDSATQGEQWTGTVHKWGYNENRESCYDKYSPKDFDVRPKPSDAHQKVSDGHQKAADGKHEDEESATRLQKMAFKEEMPRTLHPLLFECKLFSVSALYGWRVVSTLHNPSQPFTPLKSSVCGLQIDSLTIVFYCCWHWISTRRTDSKNGIGEG